MRAGIKEFVVRWGWHYLGSTYLIGLLALTDIKTAYPLLLFPLSGILVVVAGHLIPAEEKIEADE